MWIRLDGGNQADQIRGWVTTLHDIEEEVSFGNYLVRWLTEQSTFSQTWNRVFGPRELWFKDPETVALGLFQRQQAFFNEVLENVEQYLGSFILIAKQLLDAYQSDQSAQNLVNLQAHFKESAEMSAQKRAFYQQAWERHFGEPYDRESVESKLPGFLAAAISIFDRILFKQTTNTENVLALLSSDPSGLSRYSLQFAQHLADGLAHSKVAEILHERNQMFFLLIDLVWHDVLNQLAGANIRLLFFEKIDHSKQTELLQRLESLLPILGAMQRDLLKSATLARQIRSSDGFDTLRKVDIRKVLNKIETLLAGAAADKGMQLEIDTSRLPPHDGVSYLLNESDIFTAVLNLLSNAVKHGYQGTTVKLEVILGHVPTDNNGPVRQLFFEVTNQADELSQEELETFFEVKSGNHVSDRDRAVTGLGIGTQIVKLVADSHGGEVGVSQDGTTLTTWFSVMVVETGSLG